MSGEPIPAATLIVLREATMGPPELLIIRRAASLSFAGGAVVFPGGRIDPSDYAFRHGASQEDSAYRIAAIRETIEEAGVAIGVEPSPDAASIRRWRDALAAGTAFGSVLFESGAEVDPTVLLPYARWCPSHGTRRWFDTRFYVARAPVDAPPARADGTETAAAFWSTAQDVLAAVDAGRDHAIFPTRRVLERLAQFDTVEAIVEDAKAYPVETIDPWVERRGAVDWLRIPEGIGYPITGEPLATALRG